MGTQKCNACARVYNAAFAMCPFCGAAKPPPGTQPPRSSSIPAMPAVRPSSPIIPPSQLPNVSRGGSQPDLTPRDEPTSDQYAEIADAFTEQGNPYLRYEFTPAVTYGFDAMFDALYTTGGAGLAPRDPVWSPTANQRVVIANTAIFLGEMLLRTWGGRWIDEPDGVLAARLQLPAGKVVTPGIQVLMRLRDGARESLLGYFDKLRGYFGVPSADLIATEARGWTRLAEFYERSERWELAIPCYRRASALLIGPEGDAVREALDNAELLNTRESLAPAEVARASMVPAAIPSVPPPASSVAPPAPSGPTTASEWYAYAGVLAQRGNVAEAVAAYEQVLALDPTNIAVLLELPLGLANLGRIPDAVALAERAVATAPNDPRTYDSLAVLRASAGHLAEAIAAIDAGLQSHPNELSLLVRRGNFLARGGKHEPARLVLEHALQVDPAHFEARLTYADCLRRMGYRAEALAQLEQALTVSASQPPAIVDFARTLRARWAQEA